MKSLNIKFLVLFAFITSFVFASNFPVEMPEIEGWYISEKEEVYYPDNLWNYINGAADMYLEYEFIDLHIAEYRVNEKYFYVELYHHKDENCAFGIYTHERPTDIEMLDIGAQAYQAGAILNFLVNDYYIKLSTNTNDKLVENTMLEAAEKIAVSVSENAGFPKIIQCFPDENKILNTEKYIHKNYLGIEFLKHAFSVKYQKEDEKYELFIIENPDPDINEKIIKSYLEFAKQPSENINEGYYLINDKYNGEIGLYWSGTFIWGIINQQDEHKRKELINKIHTSLQENNYIIIP